MLTLIFVLVSGCKKDVDDVVAQTTNLYLRADVDTTGSGTTFNFSATPLTVQFQSGLVAIVASSITPVQGITLNINSGKSSLAEVTAGTYAFGLTANSILWTVGTSTSKSTLGASTGSIIITGIEAGTEANTKVFVGTFSGDTNGTPSIKIKNGTFRVKVKA